MKKQVRILSLLLTVALLLSMLVPSFVVAQAKSNDDGLKRGSAYQLVNKKTGTYLTKTEDSTFDPPYDTRRVVLDEKNDSDAQIWELLNRTAGSVSIIAKTTGKSLHKTARLDDRLSEQSYCVVTNSTSASPQQYWNLIDAGNGYFRLQNTYISTEYLTSTALESEVISGKYDVAAAPLNEEDDAQLWKFVKVADPPIPENNVEPIPGYPLDPIEPVSPVFSKEFDRVSDVDVTIDGYLGDAIDYITEGQAKGTNWKFLVDQIRYKQDYIGNTWQNWRGEFWGKNMRGACWLYQYTKDEELYDILEYSVRDLLSTQEENGRISSFPLDEEFTAKGNNSFDLWNRKYIMLGLQYFYEICKDEELKAYILKGLCISADYIISKVGPNEGQISILEPIDTLGGSSTSSILDPFVNLYKLTGYQRYLDFCDYIIEMGGSSKVNFYEAAYRNDQSPFQFANGSGHAYAYTSNFEALAEYAMLTGNEKWLQAVKNYAAWIIKDEITILGSGSINEHWANTALSQDNPDIQGLQETCISVTWMKFCEKMLSITGDPIYADQIEKTAYNALLGAMQGPNAQVDDVCSTLYWDYFTLYNGTRHHEFGGHIEGVDSCCSASGISGLGVIPLAQIMNSAAGPVINLYSPGSMAANTPSGNKVRFDVDTNYPVEGEIKMVVQPDVQEQFTVKLRIPAWSEQTVVKVNGAEQKDVVPGTFLELNRTWKPGDTIEISMDFRTWIVESPKGKGSDTEGNIALVRGPVVLARDSRFNDGMITDGSNLKKNADGSVDVTLSETKTFDNNMELIVNKLDGSSFRMTDYPSAGNTWKDSYATCLSKAEPVELKENTEYLLYCVGDGNFATANGESGSLYRDPSGSPNNSLQSWVLERSGDSFLVKNTSTGTYLNVAGDYNGAAISLGSSTAWNIDRVNSNTFTIASANGGKLFSGAGNSNAIHLWENGNSELQLWRFIEKDSLKPMELKENTDYYLYCKDDNRLVTLDETTGNVYRSGDSLPNDGLQTWTLELEGEIVYLKNTATGQYLTVAGNENGSNIFADSSQTDSSRWRVQNKLSNEFVISDAASGKLMSGSGGGIDNIHLWENGGSDLQIWKFVEKATEEPEGDKTELQKLYDEWKDLDLTPYINGAAKDNFTAALKAAEETLLNENATQPMVDKAYTDLETAAGALQLRATAMDKALLKKVIDYANAQKEEGGDYHKAIESVKKSFDAALENAEKVYAETEVASTQVTEAWTTLMNEIHKLGFIAGDKTKLQADYDIYSQLNLDNYLDGAEKDAFIAALDNALAVLKDGDAMANEVDAADQALIDAANALILKGDKTQLKKAVEEANKFDLNNYVEAGQSEFTAALSAADEVLGNDQATQTMVDEALNTLLEAMLNLRLKADKSLLTAAAEKAAAVDVSLYSEESVARFNAAQEAVNAMLADKNLSVESQAAANAAAKELEEAILALEPVSGAAAINGDSTMNTASSSAKTGDAATLPLAMAAGIAALAFAGYAVSKKRK
ncbi:MAG: glycoside hydrolase family 127 protein [Massilioclostridium sp.]|nr:glycoside hydrolase family 127 protein [Massilioclostridium sp.]